MSAAGIAPAWTAAAPVLVLAGTGLFLLILDAIYDEPSNTLLAGVGVAGSVITLGISVSYMRSWLWDPSSPGGPVFLLADAIKVDGMALFFTAIFASVTSLVVVAAHDYMADRDSAAEFYSLVLFAATGMSAIAISNSLATVFIALELTSLPSYALVAFLKTNRGSAEAGLKYFLIGAVSSAVFVFGISLVYAATGSLLFGDVAASLGDSEGLNGVAGIGILFILGGVAFKTASVPFHFWAPEAYEGSPAPVSAFLSSASKAAGFAVGFRVFLGAFPLETAVAVNVDWVLAFGVIAIVTMTVGNFAAAVQTNVKRMLAYSSIGHAGYVLIGLAALSAGGSQNFAVTGASLAHLMVYGFMNTGAFLFIAMTEYWGIGRRFEDFAGLSTRAPAACLAMTVFMFSLAGLPPFGGFFSKYFLFMGAVGAGFWWLAAVGAINSTLSLFYYSRVVKAMWLDEPNGNLDVIESRPTGLYTAVIVAGVATLLLLPAFGPVIETAEAVAASMF